MRGAYHWRMISKNHREHHPFTVARYKICLEMLGELGNRTVVDFGCGDGALAGMIAKVGNRVIGVEPNELGLRLAREKFDQHGLSATFYSSSSMIDDCSCDVVVCADVIEHVDNPDNILAEIFRILKPGGDAVISTPIRLTESPIDKKHVKEFFPSEFESLCEKYGRIIEMRQAIPLAALELFYIGGFFGKILKLILRIRSIWFCDNYLLNWKGLNRYFAIQVIKIRR